MKGRVWFETLGCKANQYDTEKLRALLEGLGWVPVSEPGDADLVLVNTCAVTSVAEKKSRQALSRARKLAPRAKVAALGCWAKRLENLGKPFPQTCDLALGEGAREEGFHRLLQALGEEDPGGFPFLKNYRQRHRAFLKVQDGCDFHCTYCVIPSLRGPSRSRPLPDVLEEAASLVRAGTRELVLTGVCLGDWREKDQGLEKLVQGLLELKGTFRLRLSSVDPERVTPALLEVLGGAGTCRVCPPLLLPLQSGSDRVLKRMGRRYRAGDFRSILKRAGRVFGPSFSFT
ncbi:MAG TPA: radical SAM protein, partial [Planctomycetes bacterium]|nr:radical SAM protein [Planctomycetota bacterium]